jgi:hypothetical protein
MYKKGYRVSVMRDLESLGGGIGRFLGILVGGLFYDNFGSSYPGRSFPAGLSAPVYKIDSFTV